jgi:hypothetical protein
MISDILQFVLGKFTHTIRVCESIAVTVFSYKIQIAGGDGIIKGKFMFNGSVRFQQFMLKKFTFVPFS